MAYISFQPPDFFNPVLYSATGSSQAVTGVGFAPDFTWIKLRTSGQVHCLTDSIRGVTKYIQSNSNAAEVTNVQTLTGFDSDGFTIGTDDIVSKTGNTAVSWNWKAGTTTGIAGSPSITPSSYSFNATSGQSIIAYTGNATSGATLPHGLGTSDIGMIIVKRTNGAASWQVFNKSLGATKYLQLDTYDSVGTGATRWNDTAPTSTLFSLGSGGDVNGSSDTYIAYVFAEKKGYSRFGGYTGTGDVNGPFIYTGFRPACVLIKNATGSSMSWTLRGSGLNPFNPADGHVVPNETAAEASSKDIDILSNGFKARTTDGGVNGSGNTIIYAAWAEFPIVSSNDVPTVAR